MSMRQPTPPLSPELIEAVYREGIFPMGEPDGTIDIVCEKRGKEFVVTIRDYGEPFDPRKVARPKTRAPLSERNIGGLGIFFMHKLMDRVDFDFSAGRGNVLTMRKKIGRR